MSKYEDMAKLNGVLSYTGSIGGLCAYKMRGVDQVILREKGGPSKEQVKKSHRFAMTRRRNEEWAGGMAGVRMINLALHGMRHLGDYNSTGSLSGLCRKIQDDDTTNVLGRRSVLFSRSGYKLEGFGLNKYHPFDSVLKHPLQYEVNAVAGTAGVHLSEINPGIHLTNPMKQPLYRLVFVLGALPDIVFDEAKNMYQPVAELSNLRAIVHTAWQNSNEKTAAQQLSLLIDNWQQQEGVSLVLSAGVEYGHPAIGGEIQCTKYAGAGKVLKLV